MCESAFAIMRPKFVVVWSKDLSPPAKNALSSINRQPRGAYLGSMPFYAYEGWPEIPDGADLFDYSASKSANRSKAKIAFQGCFQTFSPRLEYPVKGSGDPIKLCVQKQTDDYIYKSTRWCDAVRLWYGNLPKRNYGFGVIPYTEFIYTYLAAL